MAQHKFQETTALHLSEESRSKNSAARLSIIVAASLIAMKTSAGWFTGSISVWASLLDSLMDIFASTVNFLAVRTASRPADDDHAYGHGKAESLAGLFQALVIAVSGGFLIREAVLRIMTPHEINSEWIGIATMLIAMLASVALVRKLRATARQTDSPALAADALHYASDVYTNAAALLALVIVWLTGVRLADPILSLGISCYILWSAISVARESIDTLMDRRLPVEIDEQVAEVIRRYQDEGVHGFHDLRTRRSGAFKFIDLHLEIDGDQSLKTSHELTVRVLHDIETQIPRSTVNIHTHPVEADLHRVD